MWHRCCLALICSLLLTAPSLRAQRAAAVVWEAQASGVTTRLRGLHAVSADVAWASGAAGTLLRTRDGGRTWVRLPFPDSSLDLRDVEAHDARTAIVMSAAPGQGSRIYRTEDGGASWSLRYTAPHPAMFLDAIAFDRASRTRGYAFSDSVDGRFVVLATEDGGRTWTPLPDAGLPRALPGEGAFAASGTNIAVQSTGVWIATTASRVLRTADAGRSWSIVTTPVRTGDATGIFSIAMRDARHGIVVGGAYPREQEALQNVAVTADGGVTWQASRGLSGYRSVVVHVPALGARAWLALGPSGTDLTVDDGRTWTMAGADGFDTASVAPDGSTVFAAGAGGRIARLRRPR